jgi:hypothetical protein
VLPTGGTARFFSPLGVEDFLKRMTFARFEPPKLRDRSRRHAPRRLEGLGPPPSVDLRLRDPPRAPREAAGKPRRTACERTAAANSRRTRETDIEPS